MSDVNEVVIGRFGWDFLRITLLDRRNPPFFDAEVEVHCRPWAGKFVATFFIGELHEFAGQIRELYRDLHGPIRFEQKHERFLTLELKGDGRGHVWLSGIAGDHQHQLGTRLVFEFGLEQTQLPGIAAALEAMDPVYPAKATS